MALFPTKPQTPPNAPAQATLPPRPPEPATQGHIVGLGSYLLVALVFSVYVLLVFWPVEVPKAETPNAGPQGAELATPAKPAVDTEKPGTGTPAGKTDQEKVDPDEADNTKKNATVWQQNVTLPFAEEPIEITNDVRALLIVLAAGAIGSLVHATRSFIAFAGGRQLVTSWIPWYLLRPVTGAAMALIFYLTVRYGFMEVKPGEEDFGVGAIAALAALVGLFSEQAFDKLKQVFSALLSTTEPSTATDELKKVKPDNPEPEVSALNPASVRAATPDLRIQITGKQFVEGAVVHVDGGGRDTEVKSATEVSFLLTASDVATAGSKKITVVNPTPGGGESKSLTLTVTP